MTPLENFTKSYNELTEAFAKKYYWEEAYVENPLEDEDKFMHPIWIADDYWSLDDIWLALVLDVPKDIVHKWYKYLLDNEFKKPINFYNFIKLGL